MLPFFTPLHINHTSSRIGPSDFAEWLMHVIDQFILVSIGQVVGWLATLYAESDHRRLGGHLVVTTIGAFFGGYLSLRFHSEGDKLGMIAAAFLCAGTMLYLLRYRKWR